MKTNRKELAWGLTNEIPDDAPAGYGARCIQEKDMLDFVWDRQDIFAIDEAHQRALSAVFDRDGFVQHVQTKYSELFNAGKLQHNRSGTEFLFEDQAIKVVANTNSSHGYVYLAAYLKPSDDVSKLAGKDHPEFQNWENKAIKRWTHKRLPAIGEQINANSMGKVTVLRYLNLVGWLHLISLPLDPPEWFRKQAALGKTWQVCSVVGGEVRELENT